MNVTLEHYYLLEVFPEDKSPITGQRIKKATSKLFDEAKLLKLIEDLTRMGWLVGGIDDGLAITDGGALLMENFLPIKKRLDADNLTIEKLKLDVKNARRVYNSYWWTFAMAIIGLAISVALLILKITEPPK